MRYRKVVGRRDDIKDVESLWLILSKLSVHYGEKGKKRVARAHAISFCFNEGGIDMKRVTCKYIFKKYLH